MADRSGNSEWTASYSALETVTSPQPTANLGLARDYDILKKFYQATNGPNWKSSSGTCNQFPYGTGPWNLNLSPADPDFEDEISEFCGIEVVRGRVSRIVLVDEGLSGKLPSNLHEMDSLVVVNLGSNNLTGEIPPSWGEFKDLRNMLLPRNRLTGSYTKGNC